MAIVPFRWQGKARREEIGALVALRAQEWLRQWSSRPLRAEVDVVSGERPDSGRNSDRWYQVAGQSGTLSLRIGATVLESLACSLAGTIASDKAGLATGIGLRALRDLTHALVKAGAGDTLSAISERPAPQSLESRCGAVGLRMSLESIQIEIYLDAKLCDALAPPVATTNSQPLTPRNQTIGNSTVTLDAVLDLGSVALSEAQLLRPGEILKTGIPLDAPITIRSESGAAVLTGVLTIVDGHRAVRCVKN